MANKVRSIPEGYHSITPYLIMKDAGKAVEFYKKAFNAKEIGRISMPGGVIGHAELEIEGSKIMLSEEMPEWGNTSPATLGGTPVGICLYISDVDKTFKQAVAAGAEVDNHMEPKDQFYGDRTAGIIDPFGHKWMLATHIEDVTFEEMQKRSDKMVSEQQSQ